jgi:hypothetical protein
VTAEAVVGGVIGPLDAPEALILSRLDDRGRLRVAGRTSPLAVGLRVELGAFGATDANPPIANDDPVHTLREAAAVARRVHPGRSCRGG